MRQTGGAAKLEVTQALRAMGSGSEEGFEQLVEMVYSDLQQLAHLQLAKSSTSELQTTDLVHELFLKLTARNAAVYENRGHFFGACATAMRHILIDEARTRTRAKRGGKEKTLRLSGELFETGVAADADWLVGIDLALGKLAASAPRLAQVFECRFFAGYSAIETAEVLGISLRTVARDWNQARAWLRVLLDPTAEDGTIDGAATAGSTLGGASSAPASPSRS